MKRSVLSAMALFSFAICASAHAQDDAKVPYWATISADVANMRVGPANTYKIDWVYRRLHLPVKVVRREGAWRLIEDPDGAQGWMRDLLLSRERGGIVSGKDIVSMRTRPDDSAPVAWRLEPGVVGVIADECRNGWCPFDVNGHQGFVRETRLWGTGEP